MQSRAECIVESQWVDPLPEQLSCNRRVVRASSWPCRCRSGRPAYGGLQLLTAIDPASLHTERCAMERCATLVVKAIRRVARVEEEGHEPGMADAGREVQRRELARKLGFALWTEAVLKESLDDVAVATLDRIVQHGEACRHRPSFRNLNLNFNATLSWQGALQIL